jgi:hypothetical protein
MRRAALPQQSTTDQPAAPREAAPGDTPTGPARQAAAAPAADVPDAVLEEYHKDRFRFAARVGAQAARALAHAHRSGHLHRDVKPSNLMVDPAGQVYLVDFGLTRALLPGGDGSQPGSVRGTPWYMSPEQARGQPIDHRSDVYSLGVTLYELATGGVGPYTASRDNTEAVLAQVKAGSVLPLGVLARDVPAELERVVRRCLQCRPGRRYADAEELAADLEKVRGAGAGTPTPSRRRFPAVPVWLKLAALAGSFLLAVTALLALAPALFRNPPPPTAPARRWNVPSPLLARDFSPLQDRRLAGKGRHSVQPHVGLLVESVVEAKPTLFALGEANDVCFEFATDFRRLRKAGHPGPQEVGAFFGWRNGPDGPAPCFVVAVADPPKVAGAAVVQIKAWVVDEGNGGRAVQHDERSVLLPDRVLLPVELARPDDWHTLRVQVRGPRVAIFLDDKQAWEFETAKLRRHALGARFEPRGELGLWAREAVGAFRNAAVTPLPPEEAGP